MSDATACECGHFEQCPFIEGCEKVARDDEAAMAAQPCPVCEGWGTRGQMTGNVMAVVDCPVCEGAGNLGGKANG